MKRILGRKLLFAIYAGIMLISLEVIVHGRNISVVEAATTLQNPSIDSEGVVTWDCIYFGDYYQSEYYPIQEPDENSWERPFTDEDGTKYARLSWYNDNSGEGGADYFKYEPIKWRVLAVNGNEALLVSDVCLDIRCYYKGYAASWDISDIRKWLNAYDEYDINHNCVNQCTSFINEAFSSEEQEAILTSTVVNNACEEYGTGSCQDTQDKIFLLSAEEITNSLYGFSDNGETSDKTRFRKGSDYVYMSNAESVQEWWLRAGDSAGGENMPETLSVKRDGSISCRYIGNDLGICPALYIDLSQTEMWSYAGTVRSDEQVEPCFTHIYDQGKNSKKVTCTQDGEKKYTCVICGATKFEIVPAQGHVTILGTILTKEATCTEPGILETTCRVCGEKIVEEVAPTGHSLEYFPDAYGTGIGKYYCWRCSQWFREDKPVYLTVIGDTGKIAAGKNIKLKAQFTPENYNNKNIKWESSNPEYATVSQNGVVTAYKDGIGKAVIITATNWEDEIPKISASYKLQIVKDSVKSIRLNAPKTVKSGKKVKIKTTIKTTGKTAYKGLQWSVNNTKYATIDQKGVVKTKSAGKGKKIKVTACAVDGSKKKATITIKIK
ncbi:MAG: DUF6273 domain-containing protein [Lachnospiraceae bacterium]